jgi:hypothetical protein
MSTVSQEFSQGGVDFTDRAVPQQAVKASYLSSDRS